MRRFEPGDILGIWISAWDGFTVCVAEVGHRGRILAACRAAKSGKGAGKREREFFPVREW